MTLPVRTVLGHVLLAPDDARWYGLQVIEATGLPSGTVYPILARLETAGFFTGEWEQIDAAAHGRPPRRYYRWTPGGRQRARTAMSRPAARRLVALVRPPWTSPPG
jgi:PadR family transcriptional regulator PadR